MNAANETLTPRRSALALSALRSTPSLKQASLRALGRLISEGELWTYPPGASVCSAGADADMFLVVLEGDLLVDRGNGEYIAPLLPGGVFGLEALLENGRFPANVKADGAARVLRFHKPHVLQLLDDSVALRQALRPITPATLSHLETAEVIQLTTDLAGVPLSLLTELLAKRIVLDFEDAVLVLTRGESTTEPTRGSDGVYRAVASPAEVRRHAATYDYIFLDGYGEPPPPVKGRGDFTNVALLRGRPPIEGYGGAWPPSVSERADRPIGSPGRTKIWPGTLHTIQVDDRSPPGIAELGGFDCEAPPPTAHRAPVWVKLRLDLLRGRPASRGVEGLDADTDTSLKRWARALTSRRVGVTLSGGGAWGFIHLVLLERLEKSGVPIDLVASASVGTVVGAFYCAGGLEGGRELLRLAQSGELDRAAQKSVFRSSALQALVEKHLGPVWLEKLTTRFHPVTTDLNRACGVALTEGPLGLAVRASCSAPGVWEPTILGGAHFVDGCVAHNNPASILPGLGAHLVFASNCFPAGPRMHDGLPGDLAWMNWLVSRASGFMGRLPVVSSVMNLLVTRAVDMMVSGNLMLHAGGELEGQSADVAYDERPVAHPLAMAMHFKPAPHLISETNPEVRERLDLMNERADLFVRRWERLKARGRIRRSGTA